MKKILFLSVLVIVITAALSGFRYLNLKDAPKRCSIDFRCYTSPGQGNGVSKMRLINAATGASSGELSPEAGEIFKFSGTSGVTDNFYGEVLINSGTWASNDISYFPNPAPDATTTVVCNPSVIPKGSNWYRCNATALPYGCRASGLYISQIHLFNATPCHN
ncbi:MAG: hypothetical protein QM737_14480 [Ferruginibacter sp.]